MALLTIRRQILKRSMKDTTRKGSYNTLPRESHLLDGDRDVFAEILKRSMKDTTRKGSYNTLPRESHLLDGDRDVFADNWI